MLILTLEKCRNMKTKHNTYVNRASNKKDLSLNILSHVRGLLVTYRQVSDWILGFIDILCTQLGTTGN